MRFDHESIAVTGSLSLVNSIPAPALQHQRLRESLGAGSTCF